MRVWYNNQMEKLIPVTLITEDNNFHNSKMNKGYFLSTRSLFRKYISEGDEDFSFLFYEEESGRDFIVSDILLTLLSVDYKRKLR